ncbi:MAG: hypothetical protein LAO03_11420 [Acidobacteriia bacterium]|nr:hypothetical protein [Terriglobia bacterium]
MGNFTNASFIGHYAYTLRGIDLNTGLDFRESGVLTSDGNGNITSGEDDFLELNSGPSPDTISGTYTIRNDGIGVATVNFGLGGSITLALTLVSSSRVYVTEVDTFATAAGSAVQQDTNVISLVPSGTFAFHMHTANSQSGIGSTASVGAFTVASGIANGTEDSLTQGGVVTPLTLTGSFFTPDAAGRGTGTITDSALHTTSFTYYVVNASTVRLMVSDLGVIGLGMAEAQTGAPFTNASLTGSYAFGTRGDTLIFGTDGVGTAGRFTADGIGGISAGAFDSVQDGTPSGNVTFTGTYNANVDGKGEVTATLTPSVGSTIHEISWMVNPNRAFLLVDDPSRVEDGSADTQQAITYANSTLTGQFAFFMHGYTTTPATFDRNGTLIPNGNGGMTLTYFLNNTGAVTTTPISLTGTYAVTSTVTGRYTGSVNTLSNNLVFYMISGNDGYVLQADTGTEIDGNMSKQP